MHNNLLAAADLRPVGAVTAATATAAATAVGQAWWGTSRALDAILTLVILDVTVLTVLADADGPATELRAIQCVDSRSSLGGGAISLSSDEVGDAIEGKRVFTQRQYTAISECDLRTDSGCQVQTTRPHTSSGVSNSTMPHPLERPACYCGVTTWSC